MRFVALLITNILEYVRRAMYDEVKALRKRDEWV
jgi:hypothetical protein